MFRRAGQSFTAPRQDRLDYVERNWTDMRPKTLAATAAGA